MYVPVHLVNDDTEGERISSCSHEPSARRVISSESHLVRGVPQVRLDPEDVGAFERSDSSGVHICKSVGNYLRHGNYICKSEVIYLPYEHRIEIPVEFTYVNQ